MILLRLRWALLGIAVMIAAVGCAPGARGTPAPATATLSSAAMTATAFCFVTRPYGGVMAVALFGTPEPFAGVPTATPTPLPPLPEGDAARGETLFAGDAQCSSCHEVASDDAFLGPSLRTVADRAGYKRPGMDAATYLYGVIVAPDLTINPLTKPGVMPITYGSKLNDQQIADLIAYLLTLKFE